MSSLMHEMLKHFVQSIFLRFHLGLTHVYMVSEKKEKEFSNFFRCPENVPSSHSTLQWFMVHRRKKAVVIVQLPRLTQPCACTTSASKAWTWLTRRTDQRNSFPSPITLLGQMCLAQGALQDYYVSRHPHLRLQCQARLLEQEASEGDRAKPRACIHSYFLISSLVIFLKNHVFTQAIVQPVHVNARQTFFYLLLLSWSLSAQNKTPGQS